jgi:ribosomal protein S18 acetylase RimI-like enzyme
MVKVKPLSVQVRPATLDDIHQIAEVKIDSQYMGDDLHPVDIVMQELFLREFKKRWKQRLEEGVGALILSSDKTMLGFISYSACMDEAVQARIAEISHIYVMPAMRRQNYGTLLCKTALETLKVANFAQVVVWVPECSRQSQRFYECLGFKATSNVRIDTVPENTELRERLYHVTL